MSEVVSKVNANLKYHSGLDPESQLVIVGEIAAQSLPLPKRLRAGRAAMTE
jgi:hypothetical protein